MEDKAPYGSEPINSIDNSMPNEQDEQVVEAAPEPQEEVKEEVKPDKSDGLSKLEKMLQDSQKMIGKQANEIGQLRSKLDEFGKPKEPQGPGVDEQVAQIMQQMDEGEIPIQEGMKQVLALNSQLTASQVMADLNKQRQEEKFTEFQSKFLKENPDYEQALESGELQPYMEADPLADEYVAYKQWKADQKIAALQAEYEAKVAAAKEEGAKLAKGSTAAGKVLGKQGVSPQAVRPNRPFKNTQEATDAMMAKLAEIRSASA